MRVPCFPPGAALKHLRPEVRRIKSTIILPLLTLFLLLPLKAKLPAEKSPPDFTPQKEMLIRELDDLFRDEVKKYSVSLEDDVSGFRLHIRPDEVYASASVMKVGVMLALYRLAQRRRLRLGSRIRVRNGFRSVADGRRYRVPSEIRDECACTTYRHLRRRLSLRRICHDMIRSSSNLATNLLIDRMGVPLIRRELSGLGLRDFNVVRGMYDMGAFDRNIHNTLTSAAALRALRTLIDNRYFRPGYRREMIHFLATTEHRDKIPTLLPPGVLVAQKSGYTDDESHDAALVFPQPGRPYILVILTHGHRERYRMEEKMARASLLVYNTIMELRGPFR